MSETGPARDGIELRRWRRSRKMSQIDLAIALGWSRSYIGKIETNTAKPNWKLIGLALREVDRNRVAPKCSGDL